MHEFSAEVAPDIRYRTMILSAIMMVLLVLSHHGALDDYARDQVTDSTTESKKMYARAAGTMVAISAIKTTQLTVPLVASIKVGELLDPLSQAAARLSSALVWAMGSLLLQRIFLVNCFKSRV